MKKRIEELEDMVEPYMEYHGAFVRSLRHDAPYEIKHYYQLLSDLKLDQYIDDVAKTKLLFTTVPLILP